LLAQETVDGSEVYAIAGRPEPTSGHGQSMTVAPDRAAAAGRSLAHAAGQAAPNPPASAPASAPAAAPPAGGAASAAAPAAAPASAPAAAPRTGTP